MTVVDASAIVDLLVPPSPGRRDSLVAQLPEPAAPWLAPDILMFEVFAVIRRHVLRGVVSEARARRALDRLRAIPLELMPTAALLDAAWSLRENFSAGDSLYAALALAATEPLLTTDERLARAAGQTGIEVKLPE